ncbi:hypothetical protein RM780_00040 [Streptomyces sp. DSM 44917]|uniref:Uncharacterized protein n=1 Tax=Streptomyces boetiae TaxID=3075541 RepID=A0ABU2L1F2_9ACTN|nr:hypothetical protein [Streptomyces sp. DSM 44917]MDT0305355.1 hypothetical protein [Streptomyces sp. DSM 44917]
MLRNTLGFVLALIGAAVGLASVFFDWYGGRDGRHYRWTTLFTGDGISGTTPGLWGGMFLPMLVAAALAVAAILLRSRLLMLLSGIASLGFTVLWLVRRYLINDNLIIGADGLKWPALAALASGVLLLLSASGMAGRHVRERRVAPAPAPTARRGEPAGPNGEVRQGPWPQDPEAPRPGQEAEPGRHRRRDVA